MNEFKGILNGVPVKVVIEGAHRLNFVDATGEKVGSWHHERPAVSSTVSESSLRVRSFTCTFDSPTTASEVLRLYDLTPEVASTVTEEARPTDEASRAPSHDSNQPPRRPPFSPTPRLAKSPALERAARAARVVERFGWLILVAGTLVGFYLMTQSAQVEGLLVIFSSIFYGAATVMVAAYVQGRAGQ